MRIQDLKVGESYRLKNTRGRYGYYSWVKVLEIYKKGQYNSPDKSISLVKVKHTVEKNEDIGFTRYFRPMDLVKDPYELKKSKETFEKNKMKRKHYKEVEE